MIPRIAASDPPEMTMLARFASSLWAAAAALLLIVIAVPSPRAQVAPTDRDLRIYAGLHAAAATGDTAAIEKLIAEGEKPNLQDSRSRTPLIVAAFRHQHAAAQALLQHGANPNARDVDAFDALTIAVVNNDLEMVKIMIEGGADVRSKIGFDDGSALITAAQLGYVDIVKALIDAKADVDHPNGRGWTALITAVVMGTGDKEHKAIVEELVKAGADGDIKDRGGRKAIDYARQRGYNDLVPILEKAAGRHT
jgi:ankyrin repeat protein